MSESSGASVVELSREFVAGQGIGLRGEDVKVGLLAGFITAATAVELAHALSSDLEPDPLVEALRLASSGDEIEVREAVASATGEGLDVSEHLWPEQSADLWLYLELLALWQVRDSIVRPLEAVDAIYAQFDYPEQMASFVSYMPAPPGVETGPDALVRRWGEFLTEERARLRRDRRGKDADRGRGSRGPMTSCASTLDPGR